MKASGLFPGLFIFLCLWACEKEGPKLVDIPDAAFLEALIQQGVDLDGDGLISEEEALKVDSLVIGPYGISSLEGLAALENIRFLDITLNPLSGLDISANTQLTHLSCTSCQLLELDLSQNPGLQKVICGRNYLSELDLASHTNLTHLVCNNNLLDSLNLQNNTSLTSLITCGNRLPHLDLSQNTRLKKIGIDNMPMLEKVYVWTLPFPPDDVVLLMDYSPNVEFILK